MITYGQVNHNKIETLQALERQLGSLPLQTIYLEGNPCQQAEGVNYRRKVMLALPSTLTQIDATWVCHFISAKLMK
jgi:protein phosphatase 1 regulatory subunit 7